VVIRSGIRISGRFFTSSNISADFLFYFFIPQSPAAFHETQRNARRQQENESTKSWQRCVSRIRINPEIWIRILSYNIFVDESMYLAKRLDRPRRNLTHGVF